MLVSRIMVIVYGILSGALAVILLKLGLSLGWVYLVMGIIIGSAVFPIACSITWKKCSAFAAITASLVTLPLAIMTWLVTTATLNNGVISLETTGQNYRECPWGGASACLWEACKCMTLRGRLTRRATRRASTCMCACLGARRLHSLRHLFM